MNEKVRLPWGSEWEWLGEKAIVAVTNPGTHAGGEDGRGALSDRALGDA